AVLLDDVVGPVVRRDIERAETIVRNYRPIAEHRPGAILKARIDDAVILARPVKVHRIAAGPTRGTVPHFKTGLDPNVAVLVLIACGLVPGYQDASSIAEPVGVARLPIAPAVKDVLIGESSVARRADDETIFVAGKL